VSEEPWHLDRRVPVAMIIAILVQTFGIVWWAATIGAEVEQLKSNDARQDSRIEAIQSIAGNQAVQLGRIEENTRATQAAVERLLQQTGSRP
jgi:Tfp pilus assembly protein PilO